MGLGRVVFAVSQVFEKYLTNGKDVFWAFMDLEKEYDTIDRMVLLLLLLKKIGNARLGEGDCHPISPKTPAPHYQPIEKRKRKGK